MTIEARGEEHADLAERIKARVNAIISGTLSGSEPRYRTPTGFVRWGLVEREMRQAIDEECEAVGITPKGTGS